MTLSNCSETLRYQSTGSSNAVDGVVFLDATKAIWTLTIFAVALVGGVLTASVATVFLFIVSTGITLCLGHSLGMHRKLIHNSYDCPKWMEYLFVHLGVLVGLAGPIGMIKTHDIRDWSQRQSESHPYFGHSRPIFIDAYWQLFCSFTFSSPPRLLLEEAVEKNSVYQFMEKYWMLQSLPWAIVFYLFGGLPWVVWGVFVRMAVSILGHWLIGYFAHNRGHRSWHVNGASVQGFNVRFCGLITMGECWHNNHHAFPGSAKIGLGENEVDPGWWVLLLLQKIGLVSNLKTPEQLETRSELVACAKTGAH